MPHCGSISQITTLRIGSVVYKDTHFTTLLYFMGRLFGLVNENLLFFAIMMSGGMFH